MKKEKINLILNLKRPYDNFIYSVFESVLNDYIGLNQTVNLIIIPAFTSVVVLVTTLASIQQEVFLLKEFVSLYLSMLFPLIIISYISYFWNLYKIKKINSLSIEKRTKKTNKTLLKLNKWNQVFKLETKIQKLFFYTGLIWINNITHFYVTKSTNKKRRLEIKKVTESLSKEEIRFIIENKGMPEIQEIYENILKPENIINASNKILSEELKIKGLDCIEVKEVSKEVSNEVAEAEYLKLLLKRKIKEEKKVERQIVENM